MEIINQRCSTRAYTDVQLTPETLSTILEAARKAPSGGNARNLKLYVLQDKETLNKLNQVVKQAMLNGNAEGVSKEKAEKLCTDSYSFFFHAPTLLIITAPQNSYNAYSDTGCLLENAMLAATELQVGSCWINNVRRVQKDPGARAYLTKLGIGEDELVTAALSLGYPATEMKPKSQTSGFEVIYL